MVQSEKYLPLVVKTRHHQHLKQGVPQSLRPALLKWYCVRLILALARRWRNGTSKINEVDKVRYSVQLSNLIKYLKTSGRPVIRSLVSPSSAAHSYFLPYLTHITPY